MRNDPKKMTSRYSGKCAESGHQIKKGDAIIYWPHDKTVYLIGHAPNAEQAFRVFLSLAYEEDHGCCTY